MKYADRDRLVAGLREFADFIEEKGLELPITNPEFSVDYWIWEFESETPVKERAKKAALAMGQAEKRWSQEYLDLVKKFGPVTLEFTVKKKDICERKVVGVEEVPEQVIPAFKRDIVEWDCHEPLLAK